MLARMRTQLLLLFLGATVALSAQTAVSPHTLKLDDPTRRPPAKLADLDWLEGRWDGTGFGARAEEIWTGVDGQSLLGMFRLVKDGSPLFYEIIVIVEEAGSLVMRLKHFDSTLKGWEEKEVFVSFPLVKLEGRTAWFEGLTYSRGDDDKLRVWLLQKSKDGAAKEAEFVFERKP